MVAACVGAGLLERARRVTYVSCALAASVFTAIGLGVAISGRSIAGVFTDAEKAVSAASDYFQVTGVTYGFIAVSVVLLSAYQG
jgi:Na+-driven multidrug efflux pump